MVRPSRTCFLHMTSSVPAGSLQGGAPLTSLMRGVRKVCQWKRTVLGAVGSAGGGGRVCPAEDSGGQGEGPTSEGSLLSGPRELSAGLLEGCTGGGGGGGWGVGDGLVQSTGSAQRGPESSLLCLICDLVHEGEFGFPVQVRLGSGAVPGPWRGPVCAWGVGWPSQSRSVWGRPRSMTVAGCSPCARSVAVPPDLGDREQCVKYPPLIGQSHFSGRV